MIAHLSGKIISATEGQIILKIPSGVGYLVRVDENFLVNENLEVFVWQNGENLYGFRTFLERNWAESLASLGIEADISCQLVWKMGEQKISQALIYHDLAFFESFGIATKVITKMFKLLNGDKSEDKSDGKTKNKTTEKSILSTKTENKTKLETKSDTKTETEKEIDSIWNKVGTPDKKSQSWGEKPAHLAIHKGQSGILSVDFTQEMTNLGHSRGDIVSSITMLKGQNYWENVSLENLVQKAEKLLKSVKVKNEKLV
jgi:Holliday junction resolvasome RuvABC DNA-binding subunit